MAYVSYSTNKMKAKYNLYEGDYLAIVGMIL
jgi:hypothetical protein